MKHKAFKVSTSLFVVASVAAGLGAFAVTGPARLATLTTSGQVSFGSPATVGNTPLLAAPRNRAAAGDMVTWIDTFQNAGAAVGSASVTDTFDPTRQQLVAGSLKVPAGWVGSYTTDGRTWVGAEPADLTTVSGVQASAEFTPELGKPGVVTRLAPPSVSTVSTSIAGGGDSFFPVFRKQNVYSILHHANLNMTCFSKTTGLSCGSVRPTKNLLTSDHADAWVDTRSGRAYTPAVERLANGTNNVVFSCLDLDNKRDCGTTVVDTGATVLSGSYQSQPWQFANEIFSMYRKESTGALMVACISLPAGRPCAGQPYAAGLPTTVDPGYWASRELNVYWAPDGVNPYRTDGKVSYTAVPDGTNFRSLECFDSVTKTACAGVARVGWDNGQDPLIHQTAAGVVDGFCGRAQTTDPLTCFDFLGQPLAVSAALEAWMPQGFLSWLTPLGGYGTTTDGMSLMPDSSSRTGKVICFDWSLDAGCAGFPMTTPKAQKTYSLRRDPTAPTCVWSMGDDGFLETVESVTGMSGCSISTSTVTPTYCDGRPGHVRGWDQIKLNNLSGAHSGFSVTLRNALGNDIAGWSLKKYASGVSTIDISAIPYGPATRSITAEFQFKNLSASAFASAVPTLEVTWIGDPLQVCSSTRVVPVCPALFTPLVPNVITRRSDALTVVGATRDAVGIDLGFDSITPLSCATPSLTVQAAVNGSRTPVAPGPQVRQGSPLAITYTVRNTGTTLIGTPTLTDDAGTPATSDDPSPTYVSGDTNNNGIIEQNETWLYQATGSSNAGQSQSHPTVTGSPLDVAQAPIAGVAAPTATDRSFYFVAAPQVELSSGIFVDAVPGASCATSRSAIYADRDAPITYCYAVTNTGNVTLATVTISDPDVGATNANVSVVSGSLTNLAPGAVVVVTYSTTNSSYLVATSTVAANPGSGADVTATATTTRNVGPRIFPPT